MKQEQIHSIVLYPTDRKGIKEEFEKIGKHKWVMAVFDKQLKEGMIAHMKTYFPSNKLMVHMHFEKQEDFDAFMGTELTDPRRFLTLTLMDKCTIHMQDMVITGKDKTATITFFYTGMTTVEVNVHYQKLVQRVRKISKLSEKGGKRK